MRPKPVRFTVYKNRRNTLRPLMNVRSNGVESPLQWTNVTRMALTILAATAVTIDSTVDLDSIDFSVDGELTLVIGNIPAVAALAEGEYYARLKAIDGTGGETEIWNEDHPETPVILKIVDVS